MNNQLLIDGDILAYKASSSVQKDIDWGDGLFTCHAFLEDAIEQFKVLLDGILEGLSKHTKEEYKVSDMKFFFSDSDNFRKHYNPEYKSNRKNSRKPVCYKALVEWIKSNKEYNIAKTYKYLEADDSIGIYATLNKGKCIIISMDKDFKTIPSKFFDFGRNMFTEISEKEANYWLLYQTLVGDITDGYKGCPSYGPIKADRLLKSTPDSKLWATVVGAFKKQGLTEEDAILQATMAHILRVDDTKRFTYGELPPLFNPDSITTT